MVKRSSNKVGNTSQRCSIKQSQWCSSSSFNKQFCPTKRTRLFLFFFFFFKTAKRKSRNTANHYDIHYTGSYAYSNGAPSVYSSHYPANGGFVQPHLHEDYRPIYFYVAQPYTIPYTFAKRPRPSSLLRSGKPRSNCRVKFSKRLGNNDFSQKVKQGEFSRSLSQVHFVENQGQGMYLFILFDHSLY